MRILVVMLALVMGAMVLHCGTLAIPDNLYLSIALNGLGLYMVLGSYRLYKVFDITVPGCILYTS